MKRCNNCGKDKDEGEFYPRGDKNGSPGAWCKTCHKARAKRRAVRFKQRCVDYKGKDCIRCGYNRCIAALEFHHRDPSEKDFKISLTRNQYRWEQVKLELDKCDLVCSNCHKELHFIPVLQL